MPEISSVKSLKHKCVDFIVNNIDSFPKESLSIELEPVHPKKVPFYFKDLRILPNKFSYKISLFISLKFFFVIASSLLEELAKALRKNGKKIYRQFLHLLLVANFSTLDFSICRHTRDGLSNILPLAAENCPVSKILV